MDSATTLLEPKICHPLGPFRMLRTLASAHGATRWLAVHSAVQSSHTVYQFTCRDRNEQRRLLAAVEHLASLHHPHLLRVERFALGPGGIAWVLAPYTGNQEGLLTLAGLRSAKGGRMAPDETERALVQVLDAACFAHERGHYHGPIGLDEVLVDRHGRLSIELYSLRRRLDGLERANAEVVRDEVRSIVEMGYTLVTGLSAEEPRIPAGRLIKRLDRAWDEWFEVGLDPLGGYSSAAEAIAMLPGRRRESGPAPSGVRAVLGRMRAALRPV